MHIKLKCLKLYPFSNYFTNIIFLSHQALGEQAQTCSSESEGADAVRVASLKTFRKIWADLLPHIATMKPASDLCFTCQKGNFHTFSFSNRRSYFHSILQFYTIDLIKT